MKVLKASAGSGKTYSLAKSYIDLLLNSEDRYAYRHILAVTFTNKATAEMKSRILKELHALSATNPRAREVLTDILHDYGAFAVSTIDKFFQQALRAFSREIGHFSAYQVELDRDSLITESVDRILDGLSEERRDLVDWLKQSVMDSVEKGMRISLDDGLLEVAKRLKSEEFRKLSESCGLDDAKAFSKEKLSALRGTCRKIISSFEAGATAFGLPVTPGEKIKDPGKRARKANPELDTFFNDFYRDYCTALILDKLVFSLGIAGELRREFDALVREKNVLSLDDSNTILRDIIDGSDAPFVYEKLGVRFENFLLDEFQDTSGIQWDNFLPLLRESESNGGNNLIVGDIKQSIYRFRDSDWTLLGAKVPEAFPDAEIVPMKYNWRSCAEVVDFNNEFFSYAAAKLGVQEIYADVRQEVRSRDAQRGEVRVTFTDEQEAAVLSSIAYARGNGANWGDIAILVRTRAEGSGIANMLIKEGMPVISDDSLLLKSSVTVRRVVSLLKSIDSPEDTVGSFLSQSMAVTPPDKYHSLADMCESLLRDVRDFDPATFEGETLFIEAFMDDIQSWTDTGGDNLHLYLKHWDETNPFIGSPQTTDSIRILTIHKSKGLEFPYVIFPYADSVAVYKDDVRWSGLDAGHSALHGDADGIYPVRLSTSSSGTLFSEAYEREKNMQAVDNINIFYVALTRAVCTLHVIAGPPSKKCRESVSGGLLFSRMSEVLFGFGGGMDEWKSGEPYDFRRLERKPGSGEMDFPASYPSFPSAGRLRASDDAFDYFGPDGTTGQGASARLRGIVLHDILSSVQVSEDLPGAVKSAVSGGALDAGDAPSAEALLRSGIESHREWFCGNARNEAAVFDPVDGREYRPDRVVDMPDGSLLIIDYKFGEPSPAYARQVRHYMDLYSQMGFASVRGCLWYVRENRVETVDPECR